MTNKERGGKKTLRQGLTEKQGDPLKENLEIYDPHC